MIWMVLCLAAVVRTSLVSRERSIEYIPAEQRASPSSENISIFLNASSLGRPLNPGQGPEVTLIRAQAPQQNLPPGALGHHLLSIIQLYWRRADNTPLTTQIHYRDDDFQSILTQITPEFRSSMFTPLNLAKGFEAIAKRLFGDHDYRSFQFRWYYRDVLAGRTKTATLFPSTSAQANQTIAERALLDDEGSSANAPVVRTRFTGTTMEASQVLILFREMLSKIWGFAESDPVTRITAQSRIIVIELVYRTTSWKLQLDFLEDRSPSGPVTCYDISNRLLRVLQLPAYLERWESLNSDFLIGTVKIASISMFRMDGGVISKTKEEKS